MNDRIAVKDLKAGMRVVEYGYGRAIVSTIQTDAERWIDEEAKEDGWRALALPDEGEAFHYFECRQGSPYGPHICLYDGKTP